MNRFAPSIISQPAANIGNVIAKSREDIRRERDQKQQLARNNFPMTNNPASNTVPIPAPVPVPLPITSLPGMKPRETPAFPSIPTPLPTQPVSNFSQRQTPINNLSPFPTPSTIPTPIPILMKTKSVDMPAPVKTPPPAFPSTTTTAAPPPSLSSSGIVWLNDLSPPPMITRQVSDSAAYPAKSAASTSVGTHSPLSPTLSTMQTISPKADTMNTINMKVPTVGLEKQKDSKLTMKAIIAPPPLIPFEELMGTTASNEFLKYKTGLNPREEVIELIRRAEMEEIEQAITTAKNILTMLRSVNTGMSVDLEDIRNMQYTNDEMDGQVTAAYTILHVAAKTNDIELAQLYHTLLHQAPQAPHQPQPQQSSEDWYTLCNQYNTHGWTALHIASSLGHMHFVQWLISHTESITPLVNHATKARQSTALLLAATKKHYDIVSYLHHCGASTEKKDKLNLSIAALSKSDEKLKAIFV